MRCNIIRDSSPGGTLTGSVTGLAYETDGSQLNIPLTPRTKVVCLTGEGTQYKFVMFIKGQASGTFLIGTSGLYTTLTWEENNLNIVSSSKRWLLDPWVYALFE